MKKALLLAGLLLWQYAVADTSPARTPQHGGVYVVAHRGVHDGIPENTLAAYRKAIELGADFVEVDLRETRDGHIVSIHNNTVDDYTKDASGPVHTFTLEQLRGMDIGSRVGPAWKEERIPTFEEILEVCRGRIGIYIDLKQADVKKVVALLRQYAMTGDAVWYAGAPHLRELQQACPECIPMPDPGPEQHLERMLTLFSPKAIASTWKHITEDFVKACHAAGARVIVDDDGPETWQPLLDRGVDGIQTDHVAELISYLDSHAAKTAAQPQEHP